MLAPKHDIFVRDADAAADARAGPGHTRACDITIAAHADVRANVGAIAIAAAFARPGSFGARPGAFGTAGGPRGAATRPTLATAGLCGGSATLLSATILRRLSDLDALRRVGRSRQSEKYCS